MLTIGFVVSVVTALLLYYDIVVGWVGIIALSIFVLMAFLLKYNAQRRILVLRNIYEGALSSDALEYLQLHAQYFLFPYVSHGIATFSTGAILPLLIACFAFLLKGMWTILLIIILITLGMFRIAGSFNHPFHAAARGHSTRSSLEERALERTLKYHSVRPTTSTAPLKEKLRDLGDLRELYEQELFDEIVGFINRSSSMSR